MSFCCFTPDFGDSLATVNQLTLAFQSSAVDLSLIRPLSCSIVTTQQRLKDETAGEGKVKVKSLISKMTTEIQELCVEESQDLC